MNVLVQEFNETHPGQVDFLAIPTNNFGLQEPGANEEILNGLEHVRPGNGFKPLYKVAAKNSANGADADPLFVWLKSACLAPQGILGDPSSFYFTPIANDDITWNFEKFLVDQDGKPYKRYTPDAYPLAQMREDILFLLNRTEAKKAKEEPKVEEPEEVEVQEQVQKPQRRVLVSNHSPKRVAHRRPHTVHLRDLKHH